MGWNHGRSHLSRSGSRSMSLSNSIRSRRYTSSYSRSNSRRSFSRRSFSRRSASRSYSRSRSDSYHARSKYKGNRPVNGRRPHDRRPHDRSNGRRIHERATHERATNGYNGRNNFTGSLRFYNNGRRQVGSSFNGESRNIGDKNHVKESKISDKYNSPPFLLKIYSQVGGEFTEEEAANAELNGKYNVSLYVFMNNNFRDLVNLMKGEIPEYRHIKGFWKFYSFSAGQLVNHCKIHSVKPHTDIDSKTLAQIHLDIGQSLFINIEEQNGNTSGDFNF